MLDHLITQITSLSWIRCAIEEGISFVNNQTGEVEDNEIVIYQHLEQKSGTFDLPAAKCSPKGLEKNVLEVVGTLLVFNKNPEVSQLLSTSEFAGAVGALIEKIRNS